jgi:glutamine---fructose-6-phosphate transaminase (isomerizing)
MCGIVGAISNTPVVTTILDGLQRLEYRGYDSAGVAIGHRDTVNVTKALGNVGALKDKADTTLLAGERGIAHTRWATHGKVTEDNAHPHQAGRITLVHNGIIENHQELRNALQDEGRTFCSETDSEVIAQALDNALHNGCSTLQRALQQVLPSLNGTYGLVAMDSSEHDTLWVARSGSPMVIGLGDEGNMVSSDQLSIQQYVNAFIFLEEGDIAEVSADSVCVYDSYMQPVDRPIMANTLNVDEASKGDYDSFMAKEIFEQPAVIASLIEHHLDDEGIREFGEIARLAEHWKGVEHVHIVACGTSFHAGLVGKHYFEHYLNLPTHVEIASEFRCRRVATPKNTAFVCISQSGETADTLAALKRAKENSDYVTTLALCNVPTSSMVREADVSIMLRAGVEIGVASTKAFTTQLTALMLITLGLLKRKSGHSKAFTALFEALKTLPQDCQRVLATQSRAKVAADLMTQESALFLGRGEQTPIAMEGALKLKELSYIHAEAYAAGELKHGPLALIDDDIPVVVVAPMDEHRELLISNIEEVNARGGRIIMFSENAQDIPDNVILHSVPKVPLATASVTYILPLQLLSYFVTLNRGHNVDQPRNLAKSVTVF